MIISLWKKKLDGRTELYTSQRRLFWLGVDGNGLSWLLNIMVVVIRGRDKGGGGLSWCILIVNRH